MHHSVPVVGQPYRAGASGKELKERHSMKKHPLSSHELLGARCVYTNFFRNPGIFWGVGGCYWLHSPHYSGQDSPEFLDIAGGSAKSSVNTP